MKKQEKQQVSDFPIGLSQPALRALAGAGITRLDQLSKISEADLKKLHGLGPAGIRMLRSALEAKGLSFVSSKSAQK